MERSVSEVACVVSMLALVIDEVEVCRLKNHFSGIVFCRMRHFAINLAKQINACLVISHGLVFGQWTFI
jgi:hypothetical protein